MNIVIDPAELQSAINQHVSAAVTNALSGYEVRQAVAAKLTQEVVSGALGKAIDTALGSLDSSQLTEILAKEMQKSVTSAVTGFIQQGFVDTILRVRGLSEYSADFKAERARLLAKLEAGR